MYESPVEIILRQNIAPPVTATLQASEFAHLSQLSVEAGLLFLLERANCTDAFRQAFRATMNDSRAIIEIRQGDRIQVLARQKALPSTWLSPAQTGTLEIGVSKAQSGG